MVSGRGGDDRWRADRVEPALPPPVAQGAAQFPHGQRFEQIGQVVADFDSKMRAGLSSDRLATTTHVATDNLEGQPNLVAQVTTGHGSYVTVGNYLLYRNGLVRVQISFDANRKIAGLYLLSI